MIELEFLIQSSLGRKARKPGCRKWTNFHLSSAVNIYCPSKLPELITSHKLSHTWLQNHCLFPPVFHKKAASFM